MGEALTRVVMGEALTRVVMGEALSYPKVGQGGRSCFGQLGGFLTAEGWTRPFVGTAVVSRSAVVSQRAVMGTTVLCGAVGGDGAPTTAPTCGILCC